MTQHRDDGNPTKYFSMMLHIDHEDLNADEFYLLAYYRKIIGLNYGKPREEPITETAKGVKWKVDKTRDIRAKLASKGVIQITERSGKAQIVALADRNAANIERMKAQLATTSENSGRGKTGAIPNSDPSENGGGVSRENGGGVQAAVLKNTNNSIHKSTKVDLQSAVADVQSAPSQPQSSDGQGKLDSSTGAKNAQVDDLALGERIEDLPKSSAKKVSAETAPTVKRAPLPHIGVIEAFLAPFLKDLPPDFKIGSCARVGMDLVKAGVTIDTMREAGLLYRAWYDAIPSRTGVSWSVAAISSATSFARHMAADPLITPEYVTKYVAHIYQDDWWHDKLLTFKKVYENIGVWLHHGESPRKPMPVAAPQRSGLTPLAPELAAQMDEDGMPPFLSKNPPQWVKDMRGGK